MAGRMIATRLPTPPAANVSEASFASFVEDCLTLAKWRWWHCHDSRKSRVGFPDYVALKGDRQIVLELKRGRGRVRPGQSEWIVAFGQVPNTYAAIVRPDDWRLILEVTGVAEMGEVMG